MASVVTEASSNATYLCGLSGSVVVSVMTYAHEVSEPVPAVVETAMCGGFFGFSDLLKPSNSLTLRPSWATETRAPLQASWRGAAADGDEPVAVVLLVEARPRP